MAAITKADREKARETATAMVNIARAANAKYEAEHDRSYVTEADYQKYYRTLVRRFMKMTRLTKGRDESAGRSERAK